MDIKRMKLDQPLNESLNKLPKTTKKQKITGENLDLDYWIVFPSDLSDLIFEQLENSIEYFTGNLTKVKVFGKWHEIPRQQVAYGNEGLKYHFSGNTVPAKPWNELIKILRDYINELTGCEFNFVLINRYRNGMDYMGEHRDDEAELDKTAPIASLTLGEKRDFIFKHKDAKKKGNDKRNIDVVKIQLEHGSLLLMNPPTNHFWYHSLPQRKKCNGIRINLTFRKFLPQK